MRRDLERSGACLVCFALLAVLALDSLFRFGWTDLVGEGEREAALTF